MNTFITISGWLAVPYKEYIELSNTLKLSDELLYHYAKLLADDRNDFSGTNEEYNVRYKGLGIEPLVDFINVHYVINLSGDVDECKLTKLTNVEELAILLQTRNFFKFRFVRE